MSTGREPRRAVTGDEVDVHSRWRHIIGGLDRAGATARVKRSTNRRERREGKTDARRRVRDETGQDR